MSYVVVAVAAQPLVGRFALGQRPVFRDCSLSEYCESDPVNYVDPSGLGDYYLTAEWNHKAQHITLTLKESRWYWTDMTVGTVQVPYALWQNTVGSNKVTHVLIGNTAYANDVAVGRIIDRMNTHIRRNLGAPSALWTGEHSPYLANYLAVLFASNVSLADIVQITGHANDKPGADATLLINCIDEAHKLLLASMIEELKRGIEAERNAWLMIAGGAILGGGVQAAGVVKGMGGGAPMGTTGPRVPLNTRFVASANGTAVDLQPTLSRIASGGKFPHKNDGGVFQNLEGLLPKQKLGYYQEFVVPTPGVNHAGLQRIVVGKNGEMWYTPDHYKTFIQIK